MSPEKVSQVTLFYTTVHKFPHKLPNNLRLSLLENQEMLEECQVWVERLRSIQSCFQKLNFDNGKQKTRKIRYYVFVVFSNFAVFIYLARNILSEILV